MRAREIEKNGEAKKIEGKQCGKKEEGGERWAGEAKGGRNDLAWLLLRRKA